MRAHGCRLMQRRCEVAFVEVTVGAGAVMPVRVLFTILVVMPG